MWKVFRNSYAKFLDLSLKKSTAYSLFVLLFKINGVLGLKWPNCHISRSKLLRDIYFTPIDAEYTILYTNLRGCIALSGLEKKLFNK